MNPTMFARAISKIKLRSRATLHAWMYQFESILAQRSRRIQQLFTFYHRVYGSHGLRLLLRSYRRQLQLPLQGFVLSTVGVTGINLTDTNGVAFDWQEERLSIRNFSLAARDIEFINTLPKNKLCNLCKEKGMTYCYCKVGNKKCCEQGNLSIKNCQKRMNVHHLEDGNMMIASAEENRWEPYLSKDQFSIWKREERTGMYSYKVYARFDDITAEDLSQVQTDVKYRREWDDTAVMLHVIEEDPQPDTNSHVIYWEMEWPKLFSNRDYVYCRRVLKDDENKVIMICSRGTNHPIHPVTSDKIRVVDYWSVMVIRPFRDFHDPGVHYMLTYYDDPGLTIPQSIKSWVTQKQMPEFLQKMYMATKNLANQYTTQQLYQSNMQQLKIINLSNQRKLNNKRHVGQILTTADSTK